MTEIAAPTFPELIIVKGHGMEGQGLAELHVVRNNMLAAQCWPIATDGDPKTFLTEYQVRDEMCRRWNTEPVLAKLLRSAEGDLRLREAALEGIASGMAGHPQFDEIRRGIYRVLDGLHPGTGQPLKP